MAIANLEKAQEVVAVDSVEWARTVPIWIDAVLDHRAALESIEKRRHGGEAERCPQQAAVAGRFFLASRAVHAREAVLLRSDGDRPANLQYAGYLAEQTKLRFLMDGNAVGALMADELRCQAEVERYMGDSTTFRRFQPKLLLDVDAEYKILIERLAAQGADRMFLSMVRARAGRVNLCWETMVPLRSTTPPLLARTIAGCTPAPGPALRLGTSAVNWGTWSRRRSERPS